MKYIVVCLSFSIIFLLACSEKKTTDTTSANTSKATTKKILPDSIDEAIAIFDRRLDIKMKRKIYEPKPGSLTTMQKWFERGDTNRLIKLREEILTNDTRMEVTQYHFINNKLAQIHDYIYDKKYDNKFQQYMKEDKYYFGNDTLALATKRQAFGSNDSIPVIERATFQAFQPSKPLVETIINRLQQIDKKYNSLPYPKPRPEKGTTPAIRY